MAIESKIHAPN